MPHSPRRSKKVRCGATKQSETNASNNRAFREYVAGLLPRRRFAGLMQQHAAHCRKPQKLGHFQLLVAMVYHVTQGAGTLADHVRELWGVSITDEALVDRRQSQPWRLWERILELALGVRADEKNHPGAFYKGFRLLGMDGTMFSVRNTPWVLRRLGKAAARRCKAAFAKLRMCVLVELRLHNPVAAVIGRSDESEMEQARRLLEHVPSKSLLLIDRLYGVGSFLLDFFRQCRCRKSEFLVRVRRGLKPRLLKNLPDGSCLMEVRGRRPEGGWETMQVRRIVGWVRKPGRGRTRIELWTSLLSWKEHPARELLPLYATRWEQELTFKQLKVDLRGGELLSSHTPHSATQELACLLLAQAVLVQKRIELGALAATDVLRVSFIRVLAFTRGLELFAAASQHIISDLQLSQIIAEAMHRIRGCISSPRRSRNCPRAVRQPIHAWKRKLRNSSHEGPTAYGILSHKK